MDDVNYDKVLEDLRRRRQQLDGAISAIELMVGQASGGPGGETSKPTGDQGTTIRSDTFFGLGVPDAIKKYLGIVKRPKVAADIAKEIEAGGIISNAKNFYASVSTSLRRLEERGEVVQLPDTKEWGIASWYPVKPKAAQGGGKKAPEGNGPSEETGE